MDAELRRREAIPDPAPHRAPNACASKAQASVPARASPANHLPTGCHDRAVLLYEYVGKRIVDLQHTEVPDAYRGRGIAKHLAKVGEWGLPPTHRRPRPEGRAPPSSGLRPPRPLPLLWGLGLRAPTTTRTHLPGAGSSLPGPRVWHVVGAP